MSEERYFSEREFGVRIPDSDAVTRGAWGGVLSLVRSWLGNQLFAKSFPSMCPDRDKSTEVSGTDEGDFWRAARAWVPELPDRIRDADVPETAVVMDFIEFMFDKAVACELGWRHDYYGHHHLRGFDRAAGQRQLRQEINALFGRNRLAFNLAVDGRMMRLGPPQLRDTLDVATFDTGDTELDELLRRAVALFRSGERTDRRDSLEKLWDAYERLKSLRNPSNKKDSIQQLIDSVGVRPEFGERLNDEMQAMTDVGNDFRIRHAEVNKLPIETSEQVDFLFGRLFSLIWLLLQKLPGRRQPVELDQST